MLNISTININDYIFINDSNLFSLILNEILETC